MVAMPDRYESVSDFYQFYLSEHSDVKCRRLHFLGSSLVTIALLVFLFTRDWQALLAVPVLDTDLPGRGTSSSNGIAQPPSSIRSTASWVTGSWQKTCFWERSSSKSTANNSWDVLRSL
jgi:hypothetical protein